MLPVQRIAAEAVTYDASIPNAFFDAFPAGVRAGDHVFFLMAFASDTIAVDVGGSQLDGWEEFLNLSNTGNRIIVYRCVVDEDTNLDESPEFVLDETDVKGAAVVLAYRTPEIDAALDSAIVAAVGGSNGTFTTPSLDLARYADLYVAAVFYRGDDDALAADATAIVTTGVDGDDDLGFLSVYDYTPEVAGSSATHVYTYEGSALANYGAAMAFVLASPGVDVAPTFTLDPPGTIGLPVKGI